MRFIKPGLRNSISALLGTEVRRASPEALEPVRQAMLDVLGEAGLNEVQVEAGSRLCGALLGAGLVDEVLLYVAPVLLGDGGPGPFALGPLESMAQRTHFELLDTIHVGRDLRLRLRPLPEPDHRH